MDDSLDVSQMSKIEGKRGRRRKVDGGGVGRWVRIRVDIVWGRISAGLAGILWRVKLCE